MSNVYSQDTIEKRLERAEAELAKVKSGNSKQLPWQLQKKAALREVQASMPGKALSASSGSTPAPVPSLDMMSGPDYVRRVAEIAKDRVPATRRVMTEELIRQYKLPRLTPESRKTMEQYFYLYDTPEHRASGRRESLRYTASFSG
jgi:hypothetical protein